MKSRIGKRFFVPQNIKTIPGNAELKFQGEIFDVYQWPQEMFDGSMATFEMLRRADTVKIIAIVTPEEKEKLKNVVNITTQTPDFNRGSVVKNTTFSEKPELVITRQRQPRKDWFYDFPGGRHDNPMEDELTAAKREMREETGLEFRNWKLIDVEQPYAKIDWLVYTFVASGLEEVNQQELDAGEEIEVLVVGFGEFSKLAKRDDAKFLRFRNYKKFTSAEELLDAHGIYRYT